MTLERRLYRKIAIANGVGKGRTAKQILQALELRRSTFGLAAPHVSERNSGILEQAG